jgi:hypothetical protein
MFACRAMPVQDESLPQPQVDFAGLNYPSDTITMKELRRLYPEGFQPLREAYSGPYVVPFFETDVCDEFPTMLGFERKLAWHAFDRALAREVKEGTFTTRENVCAYLEEFYIRAGIAQGPQHARQLLRDLESAAAEQARWHIRGRRP